MKASEILAKCSSPANRYKLAQICFKLNRDDEAEKALLNQKHSDNRNTRDKAKLEKQIPNGAAGYYLLGLINDKSSKFKQAQEYFEKALELDPTLWCAFEKLASYYYNEGLENIFPPGKQILVNKFEENYKFEH